MKRKHVVHGVWLGLAMLVCSISAQAKLDAESIIARQQKNLTRIYSGEFRGVYKSTADNGRYHHLDTADVCEYQSIYHRIAFIGPPGGQCRFDETIAPEVVNGKAVEKVSSSDKQSFWDGDRMLSFWPESEFAELSPSGSAAHSDWGRMHPAYYGVTFQGGTLQELYNNLPNVEVQESPAGDGAVRLAFSGTDPFNTHVRVVVDVDTTKDFFVLGYESYRSDVGGENERIRSKVVIDPVRSKEGYWVPAQVENEYYGYEENAQYVMGAQSLSLEALSINDPGITEAALRFSMPEGTRMIDQALKVQYKVGDYLGGTAALLADTITALNPVPEQNATQGAIAPKAAVAGPQRPIALPPEAGMQLWVKLLLWAVLGCMAAWITFRLRKRSAV